MREIESGLWKREREKKKGTMEDTREEEMPVVSTDRVETERENERMYETM